jgi:hypothetical protein
VNDLTANDCIGLTVHQAFSECRSHIDWCNKWPLVSRRSPRHRYRIESIVDTGDIETLKLVPIDADGVDAFIRGGQA